MLKHLEPPMKQRLHHLLSRSSIYLAVRFPHPLTIALMCHLNEMPYRLAEVRESLAVESDEPLDMS
jgi:hypothetical protein